MSRRKVVAVSAAVIVLLIAAFFVGGLYSTYGVVTRYGGFTDSRPSIASRPTELEGAAPIPTPAQKDLRWEQPISQVRMVIYNAYISLETGDIEGSLAKIRSLAERYGGYVAGSSHSTYRAQAVAEITIRIPQDEFHNVVQVVETYGKVLDERTTSDDVTEQYIDLKARLENLQRQEKRLQEILDMARTVEDVLKVERELGRIRGEIESIQGRINYLERSVSMSVITVHLEEPLPPITPPGFDWGETLETALGGFFAVVRGLTIMILSLLPFAVIGSPLYYVYRRRKQREK